jgi:hypothetical protein
MWHPDSDDMTCSIPTSSDTPPQKDLVRTLFSSRHFIEMVVLGPIFDPEGVCTKNDDNSFQCDLSGVPLIANGMDPGYAVIFTCLGETESALIATASTPAIKASGCRADATVFHGFNMNRLCENVSDNFVRKSGTMVPPFAPKMKCILPFPVNATVAPARTAILLVHARWSHCRRPPTLQMPKDASYSRRATLKSVEKNIVFSATRR